MFASVTIAPLNVTVTTIAMLVKLAEAEILALVVGEHVLSL